MRKILYLSSYFIFIFVLCSCCNKKSSDDLSVLEPPIIDDELSEKIEYSIVEKQTETIYIVPLEKLEDNKMFCIAQSIDYNLCNRGDMVIIEDKNEFKLGVEYIFEYNEPITLYSGSITPFKIGLPDSYKLSDDSFFVYKDETKKHNLILGVYIVENSITNDYNVTTSFKGYFHILSCNFNSISEELNNMNRTYQMDKLFLHLEELYTTHLSTLKKYYDYGKTYTYNELADYKITYETLIDNQILFIRNWKYGLPPTCIQYD